MLIAIVCSIPTDHPADKHGLEPFIVKTSIFFNLFPLSLFSADDCLGFTVSLVIRCLKQFGEPTRKALTVDHRVKHRVARARTIVSCHLIREGVVTCGFFLGAWLWKISR